MVRPARSIDLRSGRRGDRRRTFPSGRGRTLRCRERQERAATVQRPDECEHSSKSLEDEGHLVRAGEGIEASTLTRWFSAAFMAFSLSPGELGRRRVSRCCRQRSRGSSTGLSRGNLLICLAPTCSAARGLDLRGLIMMDPRRAHSNSRTGTALAVPGGHKSLAVVTAPCGLAGCGRAERPSYPLAGFRHARAVLTPSWGWDPCPASNRLRRT